MCGWYLNVTRNFISLLKIPLDNLQGLLYNKGMSKKGGDNKIMTVKELQDKLEALKLPAHMTAYKASQVASAFTGKNIRTQMVVNYLGKGYLKGTKVQTEKGMVWDVDPTTFKVWLERYCFRNLVTIK